MITNQFILQANKRRQITEKEIFRCVQNLSFLFYHKGVPFENCFSLHNYQRQSFDFRGGPCLGDLSFKFRSFADLIFDKIA